jgi:hypothetical protein
LKSINIICTNVMESLAIAFPRVPGIFPTKIQGITVQKSYHRKL